VKQVRKLLLSGKQISVERETNVEKTLYRKWQLWQEERAEVERQAVHAACQGTPQCPHCADNHPGTFKGSLDYSVLAEAGESERWFPQFDFAYLSSA